MQASSSEVKFSLSFSLLWVHCRTRCRLVAFNHAHTRSLTCNWGAISWKAHWWPISCTIADSVLHQYFSCNSLHVGFVQVTVYGRAPFCIGISHAPDCMLALRISQFITVHPFASIFLMHQIACWLCAYRSLLPCTRLHRYFSCTRLHVGFAHIAVYCRAPVCIGIFHAPDCMLALRISQFFAMHPFASVILMHQIACCFCTYRSFCRAPICIDNSHAPDCLLVLRPFAGFIAPVRQKMKK